MLGLGQVEKTELGRMHEDKMRGIRRPGRETLGSEIQGIDRES